MKSVQFDFNVKMRVNGAPGHWESKTIYVTAQMDDSDVLMFSSFNKDDVIDNEAQTILKYFVDTALEEQTIHKLLETAHKVKNPPLPPLPPIPIPTDIKTKQPFTNKSYADSLLSTLEQSIQEHEREIEVMKLLCKV